MGKISRVVSAIERGDPAAAEQLLPLVYDELRRLAAARLAGEAPGQTLDATALVHEAYLRLVGPADERRWNDRGHFFAAAAEAMRRILVDAARRKRRPKHGGGRRRLPLEPLDLPADDRADDLIALNDALDDLARREPAKAELVKLRYFAGLSLEEAASCLGISSVTAKRYLAVARAWLFAALSNAEPTGRGEKKSPPG